MNAKDKFGQTPLHIAAAAGHKDVVELLIAEGSIVNAKTLNDATPLHFAASSGQLKVAEFLIAKGRT